MFRSQVFSCGKNGHIRKCHKVVSHPLKVSHGVMWLCPNQTTNLLLMFTFALVTCTSCCTSTLGKYCKNNSMGDLDSSAVALMSNFCSDFLSKNLSVLMDFYLSPTAPWLFPLSIIAWTFLYLQHKSYWIIGRLESFKDLNSENLSPLFLFCSSVQSLKSAFWSSYHKYENFKNHVISAAYRSLWKAR